MEKEKLNEDAIKTMLTFKHFKGKTLDQMKELIQKGIGIIEQDKENEAKGVISSHYHLSEEDREAMMTASYYNIMIEE